MKNPKTVALQSFFISTGIGMEEGLAQELQEVWPWLLDLDGRPHGQPLGELRMEHGGVEVDVPLHLGLQFNFVLKTAHRVLLRLSSFKVRDFPKLFQRAQKIDWAQWIPHRQVGLEVAASGSRLNNEKRISETLMDAWKLKDLGKTEALDKIYVRMFDDQVTVSLDTTGEHLHFRGTAKKIGEAPLRETLAAFCLQRLLVNKTYSDLSEICLIDPMMGSGTFLQEAALLREPLKRSFAFQKWKGIPKALTLADFQRPWRLGVGPWQKLVGFDLLPDMVPLATENLQAAGVPMNEVEVHQGDLFDKAKSVLKGQKNWCVLNPPYGERIETTHTPEVILRTLFEKWSPERIGVLWSQKQARSLSDELRFPHGSLQRMAAHDLQNGGLQVQFQIWEKKSS